VGLIIYCLLYMRKIRDRVEKRIGLQGRFFFPREYELISTFTKREGRDRVGLLPDLCCTPS
jgi:hypothetical protein